MNHSHKIREYENLHILLWLLKDVCWLTVSEIGGLVMALPTILVALHITWLKRQDKNDLFHNIAICHWICGNTTWMIGEFFYEDSLRPIVGIFFGLGLFCLAIYYLVLLPKRLLAERVK
ncbi:MAG: hypothetical protein WAX77_02705 [Methylococcaceae bacterium]